VSCAGLIVAVVVTEEEAPTGMLYRGTYDAVSRFMDDDQKEHLTFKWTFEIKKNWD
jgi:Rho GDP-dissociation inhibitor